MGSRNKAAPCCPVLALVLSRHVEGRNDGIQHAISFSAKDGVPSQPLVHAIRKAKRGETGPYGAGTEYANASYALVKFCPFCGKAQP